MSEFPMQLLGELVAVQYEPVKAAVLLPDWQRSLVGTVIAIGPGLPLQNGKVGPMMTRVGERVMFGAAVGMESMFDGKPLRILRDSEIDCAWGSTA